MTSRSCSLLTKSKADQGAAEYRPYPALWFLKVGTMFVLDSRTWATSTHCTLLLCFCTRAGDNEHMIMSMMCLRLLSQHCCWGSHSKSGWFVQQMDLTINFFPIKSSMAKWINLGTGRVGLLLIQPLIFHIPYSKGSFSLCPSHFRCAPWAASKHLTQGSLTSLHWLCQFLGPELNYHIFLQRELCTCIMIWFLEIFYTRYWRYSYHTWL